MRNWRIIVLTALTVALLHFSGFWVNPFALTRSGDPDFGQRLDRGLIEHDALDEASGIAASRKNPGVLWMHNDSGDQNRLFTLNSDGRHLGVYFVDGVTSCDWEDIALGPGPEEGEEYIYIGDIGDNDAARDVKFIYRVREPAVHPQQAAIDTVLAGAETIAFQYPDGKRDAETLMVDPLTRDIYLISKRENIVHVYRAPYPQSTANVNTLESVATLNMTNVVAGDISPSGLEILVKTYTSIFYWCRTAGQSIAGALSASPVVVPYVVEPQGEAISWDFEGAGYFTTSEELGSVPAHLYYYPRLNATSVGRVNHLPASFQLQQNYPNPFNPVTNINYSLATPAHVKLIVYNVNGRLVDVLVNAEQTAGRYSLELHARGLSSGVYFYRLTLDSLPGSEQVRKLLVLK
ncbi:MAG: T9SS type A sorting domain-containing protein [Calditrichaeota bacterium]|nr:T9SS type A sorting domain-containing protein [Calditrichota bacterium]